MTSDESPQSLGADRLNSDVAEEPVKSIAVLHVTCCMPWCDHCRGYRGIETQFNDGSVETRCVTCSKPMPDWPSIAPVTPADESKALSNGNQGGSIDAR